MKTGKYVELSVQDQISCVRGNKNCALGNLDTTYKYLELIGALSEECFPFVSQNATFYPNFHYKRQDAENQSKPA